MSEEINIRPKSDSTSSPVGIAGDSQTVSSNVKQLINICAIGLGISFFLPWSEFLGITMSGFYLQKADSRLQILWLIPAFSAVTVLAGVATRAQMGAAIITGVLPFCALIYFYQQMGNDVFHIMTYGAVISLLCGAALFILPLSLNKRHVGTA